MSASSTTTFGQRLRYQRERLNWSQERLAEAVGTTAKSINRWEHDKVLPHPYYREQLCHLFQVSSQTLFGSPPLEENTTLWKVPLRRNPYFTGREIVLQNLHKVLHSGTLATPAQAQAISGLGGVGKTQLALEYAYRFHEEYVGVLWVRAETRALLLTDFVTLATFLNLPEKDEKNSLRIVEAVKQWLSTTDKWLLILDNVEDFTMVEDFLPSHMRGHLVLTTRTQSMGMFARRINLEHMNLDEATLFLLRRAKLLEHTAPLEEASDALRHDARGIAQAMAGLPLALDQAGAYIEESGCSLSDYLDRYRVQRESLLERRGSQAIDHYESVSTTLFLCYEKVKQASLGAAELLQLCAFLDVDAIPQELIIEGGSELGEVLQPIVTNPFAMDEVFAILRKYSLLYRNVKTKTFTLHRLVQAVLKDKMNEQTQRQWAERAVCMINFVFPNVEDVMARTRCQKYFSQAQIGVRLIEQWNMTFPQAIRLLTQVGAFLRELAHHRQAEHLLFRALAIQEQTAPQHIDTARILNHLADVYRVQDKYTQAERLYQRALQIRISAFGREHLSVAQTLNGLGELAYYQGHYTEAESLYVQSLHLNEQLFGLEHPEVATSLGNLALLYRDWGKYPQAEDLFQRALAIQEKLLDSQHAYTATTIDNLAVLYAMQEKYEQAEILFQRAFVIREKTLGLQHPDVATSLNNLAKLSYYQGNYDQAEMLYLQALDIYKNNLGMEHSYTATTMSNLATLYALQEKYVQANQLFQQSLLIREKVQGLHHPDYINTLENYTDLLKKIETQEEI